MQNRKVQELQGPVNAVDPITIMDKFANNVLYAENLKAMILPPEFGDEKYKLPNLIYKRSLDYLMMMSCNIYVWH